LTQYLYFLPILIKYPIFLKNLLDKEGQAWYNMQAVNKTAPENRACEARKKFFKKLLKKYLTSERKGGIIIESLRERRDGRSAKAEDD
jgi:hypothetical protein